MCLIIDVVVVNVVIVEFVYQILAGYQAICLFGDLSASLLFFTASLLRRHFAASVLRFP